MRRGRLRSSAQLQGDLRSHDLRRLAKELKLPPRYSAQMQPCAGRRQSETQVDFRDLHQAWRYGHSLRADDEKAAVAVLRDLMAWCATEVRT
ncbi:hypothetical protein [Actinocorallia herbida]|uniref:hypothetical protein n=1 Tax=Actinocorallia herbida TaxID=58109 RepID=UPI0011CE892B|nr:hypothetical protein [Actinocorallia herbida]